MAKESIQRRWAYGTMETVQEVKQEYLEDEKGLKWLKEKLHFITEDVFFNIVKFWNILTNLWSVSTDHITLTYQFLVCTYLV